MKKVKMFYKADIEEIENDINNFLTEPGTDRVLESLNSTVVRLNTGGTNQLLRMSSSTRFLASIIYYERTKS